MSPEGPENAYLLPRRIVFSQAKDRGESWKTVKNDRFLGIFLPSVEKNPEKRELSAQLHEKIDHKSIQKESKRRSLTKFLASKK